MAARDFNGDNRVEMLFRRASGRHAVVSLMNGFQLLAAQFIGAVGTDFFPLGLGDLNGDGRSVVERDLVLARGVAAQVRQHQHRLADAVAGEHARLPA
jgi:hypothetical protein